MIRSICPKCKTELKAPDAYAGQSAQCPTCGTTLRVPKLALTTAKGASVSAGAAGVATGARRATTPPTKPKPAPAPKPRSSLAAELDSIADAALKTSAKKTAAAALTAGPAQAGPSRRSAKPSKPRPARRKMRFRADVIISIAALLAIGGVVYYLLGQILARKSLDDSRALVNDIIAEADQACQDGQYEEYEALYQKAIQQARKHKKAYQDDSFDDRVKEIQAFLESKQAQQDVWQVVQKAEAARKGNKYDVAKSYYQEVQKKATAYFDANPDATMKEYVDRAKKALASDEIRLGSQGYVLHDGKWMTEEEKRGRVMAKRGMVLYKGKWMKREEKDKLIKAEEAQRAAAKAKAAAKASAKAKAPAGPAKAAKAPPPPKPAVPAKDPNEKVWMFDDFEHGKVLWPSQSWGDNTTLSLVKSGKSTALKADFTKGKEGKCALQRAIPKPWPFESRDAVLMDVDNKSKGGFQLAIAIFTHGWKGFYESTGVYIKNGMNKDVTFDLRSKRFKCAQSGWAYKSPLNDPDAVSSIVLMIYPRNSGTVNFDNVRFTKK